MYKKIFKEVFSLFAILILFEINAFGQRTGDVTYSINTSLLSNTFSGINIREFTGNTFQTISPIGIATSCNTTSSLHSINTDTNPHAYKLYQIQNLRPYDTCIYITLSNYGANKDESLIALTYVNTFNPTNLSANLIGISSGTSFNNTQQYSVFLPATTNFQVVVLNNSSRYVDPMFLLQITSNNTLSCSSPLIWNEPRFLQIPVGELTTITVNSFGDGLRYEWTNGSTAPYLTTSTPGLYRLKITDACGKTAQSKSISISTVCPSPPSIVSQPSLINATFGETAIVSVAALGSGLKYKWNTNDSTSFITATSSGSYSVIITDVCGFQKASDPIRVVFNCSQTLSITSQPFLNNYEMSYRQEPVTLSVAAIGNGLSYSWNNGMKTPIITVTNAGYYVVTIKDACLNQITSNLVQIRCQPMTITSNFSTLSQRLPYLGGSVTVSVVALGVGLRYAWSNGATTSSFTTTTPGYYYVYITDQCGTTNYTTNLSISCPQPLTITSQSLSKRQAYYGEMVTLTVGASGNDLKYLWSNNATTSFITVSTPGSYQVKITDACGFYLFSPSIQLICPTTLTITSQPKSQIQNYQGEPITLSVGAIGTGLTYSWYEQGNSLFLGTTSSIVVTSPGRYRVTISDLCNNYSYIQSEEAIISCPTLTITSQSPSVQLYRGQPVTLSVTALGAQGLTYYWYNTPTNTTSSTIVTSPGSYFVRISDFCGNSIHSNTFFVQCEPTTITSIPYTVYITERYQPVLLTVGALGNGLKYYWSNTGTTSSQTVYGAGDYTVWITNRCDEYQGSVRIKVRCLTRSSITSFPRSQTITYGQTATLSVGALGTGLSYIWSPSYFQENTKSNFHVSKSGTYWVFINACDTSFYSSATVNVICPQTLTITSQPQPSTVISLGQMATLSVGATGTGLTYKWNENNFSNSPVFYTTAAGVNFVKVTDACGNSITSNAAIVTCGFDLQNLTTSSNFISINYGQTATLSVSNIGNGLTYKWSSGASGSSINVTRSGYYSVQVKDACRNTAFYWFNVNVICPQPLVTTSNQSTITIPYGQSTTIIASATGTVLTYNWNMGQTSTRITVTSSGYYFCNVMDVCGNQRTTSYTQVIVECPQPLTILQQPINSMVNYGGTTLLSVSATGTDLSYYWSDMKTSPSITVSTPGTYSVLITDKCGNSLRSTEAEVKGICLQTPTITSFTREGVSNEGSLVQLTATALGDGLKYRWNNFATTSSINVYSPGVYYVSIVDFCGNYAFSPEIIVSGTPKRFDVANSIETVSLGIGDNLSIFPNPAQRELFILSSKDFTLEIYSPKGVLVGTHNVQTGLKTQIDVSQFGAGLYYFNFRTENSLITRKVILL